MDKKIKYAFLHIPKTAGTTFNYILKKHFGKEYKPFYPLMDDKDRQAYLEPVIRASNARCVASHALYIDGLDRQYITFLRDPVKMNVSLYYFVKKSKPWDEWSENVKKSTLSEFIDKFMAHNTQTRWISSVFDDEECTEKSLAIAKDRLDKMCFVGIVERFDESLLAFFKKLDWEPVYYLKKNVGKYSDKISPEIEKSIKEKNHLDMELYVYAEKIYSRGVKKYSRKLKNDLSQYIEQNDKFNNRISARFIKELGKLTGKIGNMDTLNRK